MDSTSAPEADDAEKTPSWEEEARAVVADVRHHVREIAPSSKLASSARTIYLNVTTLEGARRCVEMSARGFAVVGEEYDLVDDDLRGESETDAEGRFHETPYALLATMSPAYRASFGGELVERLEALERRQRRAEEGGGGGGEGR